ncbi:hypothetical protein NDU88_005379 [Pleurodeles waltl]|uniref:Uncharacterized protein n=1 Tax=Pleurodeles waltl TaxID=8319 RepID=A0AAV7PMH0_PLEWA|nr:hypothetical protein NDU88_005379 [Pleurodeles waltl]
MQRRLDPKKRDRVKNVTGLLKREEMKRVKGMMTPLFVVVDDSAAEYDSPGFSLLSHVVVNDSSTDDESPVFMPPSKVSYRGWGGGRLNLTATTRPRVEHGVARPETQPWVLRPRCGRQNRPQPAIRFTVRSAAEKANR